MKIGVQTWGSEGDVTPFFALAEGLSKRGHEVSVAYGSVDARDYSERLKGAPFRHARVGGSALPVDQVRRLAGEIFSDPNPLRQLDRILREFLEPDLPHMMRSARELAASSDILIHHMLLNVTASAAEQVNKPTFLVLTAPMIPTRAFPPPGAGDIGPLNVLVWKLSLWVLDRKLRPGMNRLREEIGLPPAAGVQALLDRSALDLIAVSPTLLDRPPDWPEKAQISGFMSPPQAVSRDPLPADLEAFLSAGPPPIYVTFGSMAIAGEDAAETFRIVLEAIQQVRCRAILQTELRELRDAVPARPELFVTGPAPHALIFPRCAAIVHHGGAGTTQSALRSGRASVIVAHITDQFFWGRRLARLGVAPPLVARRGLTPKKLARAIESALGDPKMARRAADLGAKMSAEDGVARAIELIESRARSS